MNSPSFLCGVEELIFLIKLNKRYFKIYQQIVQHFVCLYNHDKGLGF